MECGTGEPLVFVHGGLGYLRTFHRQVQTFAAHFRVIAYSRRLSPPNARLLATTRFHGAFTATGFCDPFRHVWLVGDKIAARAAHLAP